MKTDHPAQLWSALFAVLVALILAAWPADARADAKSAELVIDAATGRLLHAEEPDARRHPASLTKMMTLYMVFEALERGRLRLDQRLPVSAAAAAQSPSKLGLRPGSSIAVDDAILGLVTKSANDVAAVVAEALGGSESAFARRMTERARQLGMSRTTFRNASGLPDPDQVTTARDMATLALALIRHFPRQYSYFATRHFAHGGQVHKNHNKLLGDYHGIDGIKTGYIRASGFNLVASARRGNTRLIGVVFGGPSPASRNRRMADLLDAGFAAMERGYRPEMVSRPDTAPVAAPPVGLAAGPSTRTGDVDGTWGLQIGAFRSSEAAARTARAAQKAVADQAPGLRPAVAPAPPATGGSFHIARLVGTDKEEADRACTTLTRSGYNCLVLRLSDNAEEVEGEQPVAVAAPALIAPQRPADGAAAAPPGKAKAASKAKSASAGKDGDSNTVKGKTVAAAKTKAPAENPPAAKAGSKSGDWGVQVGAFPARADAQKAAKAAVKVVPKPLSSGAVKVVTIERKKRSTLYGARVVGISQNQAQEACRKLKSSDFDCMVLRL